MLRSHALRTLVAGATLAAGAAIPRPARSQALVPVRLILFPGETAGAAYYARDRGLFARAGLDVQITEVTNGAAGATAVVTGAMDVGFSNPLSLAQGHERGLPFSIIAPAALAKEGVETNGYIITTKTSPIHSAKDFSGKTVSVNGVGGITDYTMRNWIDKNGGDSKSVKFLELSFPEMIPALNSGRVDVTDMNSSFDPLVGKPNDTFRLLGNSYATLAPQFLSSVWFSTNEWLAKNPETAKKFLTVMRESAVWANANHHEAAVLLAPHLKRTVESIEGSARVVFATDVTPDLLQPLIDVAAKYGGLKAAFPARDVINAVARS